MRFWDTAAVLALFVEEPGSDGARRWLRQDGELVLWTLTPVELTSAVWRRVRERKLSDAQARALERKSERLASQASLVTDVESVKSQARRLLRVHRLRAGDALQLAAAHLWAEGDPTDRILHTFDGPLATAARREGFTVPDAEG